MRIYSEISDIYHGTDMSFYLLEGKKDKSLNRYIHGHIKNIDKYLRQRGVCFTSFNTISPALFGTRSLKSLILRQNPTCNKEELEKNIKEYKEERRNRHSRLLYIGATSADENGNCVADILCEEDFGDCDGYATVLYGFLDSIVHYHISQSNRPTLASTLKFRLPVDEDTIPTYNKEYLGHDLLADSICKADNSVISPIKFDNRYNITLPLYPQITIKLAPLPKALYILLLRHPEGIYLKELQGYEEELKSIYCTISGRKNPTVVNRMIRAISDPTENVVHSSLSTIRRSFTSKLNYSIAKNYIPAHGRSKAHNIPIGCELVELP